MQMTVNQQFNPELGYVESYVTKSSQYGTGNLHGRRRHLSAQSGKLNITMGSVLGFSQRNFVINVPREWMKLALKTIEEATDSYMVGVIAESHSRLNNYFLVGFQHVSYYGRTWRSGTA